MNMIFDLVRLFRRCNAWCHEKRRHRLHLPSISRENQSHSHGQTHFHGLSGKTCCGSPRMPCIVQQRWQPVRGEISICIISTKPLVIAASRRAVIRPAHISWLVPPSAAPKSANQQNWPVRWRPVPVQERGGPARRIKSPAVRAE